MRTKFARVVWSIDDVLGLRPNWTRIQAAEFLEEIERVLEERMVERGWAVIEDLLPAEIREVDPLEDQYMPQQ